MAASDKARKQMLYATCAEALGIPVPCVKAIQTDAGGQTHTVLYTMDRPNDPNAILHQAVLWTNIEGILEVVQTRELTTVGKFADQVRMIQAAQMTKMPPLPVPEAPEWPT